MSSVDSLFTPRVALPRQIKSWDFVAGVLFFALIAGCGGDETSSDADGGGQDAARQEDVEDRLSYINTLVIPDLMGSDATCCHDFGERSKNDGLDNAFSQLADAASLAINLQEIVDTSLNNGTQVILLNHVGLTGNGDDFILQGLLGGFASGTDFAKATAGNGRFTVLPASYASGSMDPVITLDGELDSSGAMSAGPDNFVINIPLGDVAIRVTAKEAELTGKSTLSEGGVAYTEGKLWGFVLVAELYEAINTYVESECDCLGLSGDLFTETSGNFVGDCVSDAEGMCPSAPSCATFAGDNLLSGEVCGLLPTLISGNADIDTNNDNSYEALSVGFQWTSRNAVLAE